MKNFIATMNLALVPAIPIAVTSAIAETGCV